MILCLGFSFPVKSRLEIIGIKVSATTKEAIRETATAMPKSFVQRPATPFGRKMKLAKTATVVAVEARTATPTSRLP